MAGYLIKPAIQGKTGYKHSKRLRVLWDGISEKEENNVIHEVTKLAHTS